MLGLSDFLPTRPFKCLVLLPSSTVVRLIERGTLFYHGRESCPAHPPNLLQILLNDNGVIGGLEQPFSTFLLYFQPLLECRSTVHR